MVEDYTTDGKRIAQLLASELTGLETGPLADVAVVDADPDVTPTPDGVEAYAIQYHDQRAGTVTVFPDRARVSLRVDADDTPEDAAVPAEATAAGVALSVESGEAVKRAVDMIRTALARKG